MRTPSVGDPGFEPRFALGKILRTNPRTGSNGSNVRVVRAHRRPGDSERQLLREESGRRVVIEKCELKLCIKYSNYCRCLNAVRVCVYLDYTYYINILEDAYGC